MYTPAPIALLPTFTESAHSMAMVFHSNVVKNTVHHLNPMQTPVIAFQQPLFALAKNIQWHLSSMHGEDHFVILGGLHAEMGAFRALGKWLNGSGWIQVLCNANVATQGVAESFLSLAI